MQLKDKVSLVTGGSKGIGAATAIALAAGGSHVAIAGRNDDAEAAKVKQEVEKLGRKYVFITADFSKAEDCQRAVEETAKKLGGIDVVVHSAGGLVPGGLFEVGPEAWMAGFDVHVHAVYHLARAAVPLIKPKKEGAIILIASSAGKRALHTNLAYQVVKGALPHFTSALARELAADNIRVNCVAPGVIRTRFHDAMPPEVYKNNLDNRIPLKREGTSEQVADLIVALATNDYVTGETVSIDGGLTMRIC